MNLGWQRLRETKALGKRFQGLRQATRTFRFQDSEEWSSGLLETDLESGMEDRAAPASAPAPRGRQSHL